MYLEIPDIRKNIEDFKKRSNEPLQDNDIDVYLFPQCWGSTAMGFTGRVGCDVLTIGYTTVIIRPLNHSAAVYFGEEFAYSVKSANNKLFTDIANKEVLPQNEAEKYEAEYTQKQIRFNQEDRYFK